MHVMQGLQGNHRILLHKNKVYQQRIMANDNNPTHLKTIKLSKIMGLSNTLKNRKFHGQILMFPVSFHNQDEIIFSYIGLVAHYIELSETCLTD